MESSKLLLINSEALPPVYERVIEAKRLIASGEAKSATEASKLCGISRSAFYKYKDFVFEYTQHRSKILTLHIVLKDKAGALSKLLSAFYEDGANVMTVNQGLPSSGVAVVTVSVRVNPENYNTEHLLERIKSYKEVISAKQILGD